MADRRSRIGPLEFTAVWIVEVVVAVPIAFAWFMISLGLGFKTWPEGHIGALTSAAFWISYVGGIGLVVVSLISAPVLFFFGQTRLAIWGPIISITVLIVFALIVLTILG